MDHIPVTGTTPMRAITQSRYGTSDSLLLTDVPVPSPGERQVLLRVHAAGLDRGTEHLTTGKPYAVRLAMGVRRPRNPVLGRVVAGTVAETGPGVTRFAPGDEVYGVAPGSFAQYAVADVDKLATKPAALRTRHRRRPPEPCPGCHLHHHRRPSLDQESWPAPATNAP
ncbi:MAG: hypothetical protein ABIQ15_09525 [Nocardioides sp.]